MPARGQKAPPGWALRARKRRGVGHAQRCLLSVADEDLIAGFADSRPIAL